MTTIAFDGKQLAADSQITNGDVIAPIGVQKIWYIRHLGRNAVVAGSGTPTSIMGLARLFLQNLPQVREHHAVLTAPTFPADQGGSAMMIDVETLRVFHMGQDGSCVEVTGSRFACGSGREFALGAMFAGASAADAVKIAKQLDPWTGRDVHTVRLDADFSSITWQEVL